MKAAGRSMSAALTDISTRPTNMSPPIFTDMFVAARVTAETRPRQTASRASSVGADASGLGEDPVAEGAHGVGRSPRLEASQPVGAGIDLGLERPDECAFGQLPLEHRGGGE